VSLLDITDRKATDEMVRVANRKLSMLGSMTRHDISNQLTVLYASLDRVFSPAADGKHANPAEMAKEACQRIQRLLEFARDYQNAGTREPEWMDLAGTVQRAVDHFKAAGPEFVFDLGRVEVRADPMLEKVFYNLVDNSVRHGGHVTRISLSARTGDSGLTIMCADDGTGIPAEDKERIFEQGFGRNTGYGLYLVREILAITGLTIKETGVPGQGARFEIRIPPEAHRTVP
jgi:signal transduction histidine kinase